MKNTKKETKEKRFDERRKKCINTSHNLSIRGKTATAGITLIALVITILFSYDEMIKFSNSKGFLLATI